MTQRLPTPGSDTGTWGNILNGYLGVAHNADGTLIPSAVTAAGAATDTAVVHKAGSETLTGAKDFTGGATINGTNIVVTSDTRLSDARTPTAHQTSHQSGGSDALTGSLDANARTNLKNSGVSVGTRRSLNLIQGSNVTLTTVDDAAGEKVDVTIAAAGQYINVKDYGAVGNGSTNDTTAITNALNAANGAPVYLPTGTYLVTWDALNRTSATYLIGDGAGRTIIQGAVGGGFTYLFSVAGAAGSDLLLSADVSAHTQSVTVASTTGLVQDGWAVVRSTTAWPYGTSNGATKGELVRIKTISGPTVTFYSMLDDGYLTSASAKITPIAMIEGSGAVGITFKNIAPLTGTGMLTSWKFVHNLVIRDCEFLYSDGENMLVNGCPNFMIDNCSVKDSADDTSAGRWGYGVNVFGPSANGIIRGLQAYRLRHAITTGGTVFGVPRHCLFTGCTAMETTSAAFDTHAEGEYLTYADCSVHQTQDQSANTSMGVGFQVRSPRATLINPVVSGCWGAGIQVLDPTTTVGDGQECVIIGARISNIYTSVFAGSQGKGMDIYAQNCRIIGASVQDTDGRGIWIRPTATRATIINPVVKNPGRIGGSGGGNAIGIYLDTGVTNVDIQSPTVLDAANAINTALGTGVTVSVSDLHTRNVTTLSNDPQVLPNTQYINVKDYGATGNGTTDDTAAIQAAISATQGKQLIYCPAGTYKISAITWDANNFVGMVGAGPALTKITGPSTALLLGVFGQVASSITLAANASSGASSLSVSANTGLTAGDYLNISSGLTVGSGKQGEIVRIQAISGTGPYTLTLHGALDDSYTTANSAVIQKITFIDDFEVSGLTLENSAPAGGANSLAQFRFTKNLRLSDVRFSKMDSAMLVESSLNPVIDGCQFIDGTDDGTHFGSGLSVNGCSRDARIINTSFQQCRQAITASGTSAGQPRHTLIQACQAYNCTNSAFRVPVEMEYTQFIGCVVNTSDDSATQHGDIAWSILGKKTSLLACDVNSSYEYAVTIGSGSDSTYVGSMHVRDVRDGANSAGRGFLIQGTNVTLQGVKIEEIGREGIRIDGATNVVIADLHSRNTGKTAGSASAGAHISLFNTISTALVLRNLYLDGGGQGGYGIFSSSAVLPTLTQVDGLITNSVGTISNIATNTRLPGVGNALSATTPGSVTKKIEVFDTNGTSLGFVPVYSSIT